jgi:DNA gyrase subunit B
VQHSGEEHWLASKSDVDAFLSQRQQSTGQELRTADDSLGKSGALHHHPAGGEHAAQDGNGATTITVTDLHEVRTINDTLKRMQEFGLSLNDLLPPPPRNAEVVYPYEIMGADSPRRLQSMRELVAKLREIGDKGFTRTRFKGLGEMNPEELFETAMDPASRILKRVSLEDAAAAEEIFRVLMGEHVEPRREFIEKHALEVKDLDV